MERVIEVFLQASANQAGHKQQFLLNHTKTADLRAQAEKLSLYSDWAALIVSGKKTKVTGLIHNADKYGNTNEEDLLKKQFNGNFSSSKDKRHN